MIDFFPTRNEMKINTYYGTWIEGTNHLEQLCDESGVISISDNDPDNVEKHAVVGGGAMCHVGVQRNIILSQIRCNTRSPTDEESTCSR